MMNDKRIKSCLSRFDSGAYSRLQFLRAVSHSVGAHTESPIGTTTAAATAARGRRRGQPGARAGSDNFACKPHRCGCGKVVDARGLHGLACRKSAPRQRRHSHLSDIIWHAMQRAQVRKSKSQWVCSGKTGNATTASQSCRGESSSKRSFEFENGIYSLLKRPDARER